MQVEFVDRVFTKTGAGDDAEEAKARAAEAAKKKEMSKSKVSWNKGGREIWTLEDLHKGRLSWEGEGS